MLIPSQLVRKLPHYDDVIMGAIASQITSLTIVYLTVYAGADQSKHQSPASLAFVWGIHRGPVNSPHKWPVTRKMFPFDDVIMSIPHTRRRHDMATLSALHALCAGNPGGCPSERTSNCGFIWWQQSFGLWPRVKSEIKNVWFDRSNMVIIVSKDYVTLNISDSDFLDVSRS